MKDHRTTRELESDIGKHLRARRLDQGLRQVELAELANISTVTLSHLEGGKGANLTTVIKVLRALGATDWIDQLAPSPQFSPLAVLHQAAGVSRSKRTPERVRRARGAIVEAP